MLCALSGETPEHPVLSLKSEFVFERALIKKYIADFGQDPVNGEEMTIQDLIEIKTIPGVVRPRPPELTSVPSILSALQNEWDSCMFEAFDLKQQYQQALQELMYTLYRVDASSRVVARLKKERDDAREALANVQAHLGVPVTSVGPEMEEEHILAYNTSVLPDIVVNKMIETYTALSQFRLEHKKPPAEFASTESVKLYSKISEISSLHAVRTPGITCLDIDITGDLILTGGNDKIVQVYDKKNGRMYSKLLGHTRKVTSVKFRGYTGESNIVLSSSADQSVRVWVPAIKKGYRLGHKVIAHEDKVTGISIHPTKDYFASAGMDKKCCLFDFELATPIVKFNDTESETGYTSISFHPDGLLLGAGTESDAVKIWDVKTSKIAASLDEHRGAIRALSFSGNGYILAVASQDNLVNIWDLRSLRNTMTFKLDKSYKINSLAFDGYGEYIAVGGTDVRVLSAKTGFLISQFTDNTNDITAVHWSPLAQGLTSSSLDRAIRFYGSA
ncbi:WD40 repeat-like protein [Backusella circina FSU 941]|nr:WD40 repeat-like protein [Backusella circina FSU 941]